MRKISKLFNTLNSTDAWTIIKYLFFSNLSAVPVSLFPLKFIDIYQTHIESKFIESQISGLNCERVLMSSNQIHFYQKRSDVFCENATISQQVTAATLNFISESPAPSSFSTLLIVFILANIVGLCLGIRKVYHTHIDREIKEAQKEDEKIDNRQVILEFAKEKEAKYELERKLSKIPQTKFSQPGYTGLLDPTNKQIMRIPCLLSDGYLYDVATALNLLDEKKSTRTSPINGEPLNNHIIIDQDALGDIICLAEGKEIPIQDIEIFMHAKQDFLFKFLQLVKNILLGIKGITYHSLKFSLRFSLAAFCLLFPVIYNKSIDFRAIKRNYILSHAGDFNCSKKILFNSIGQNYSSFKCLTELSEGMLIKAAADYSRGIKKSGVSLSKIPFMETLIYAVGITFSISFILDTFSAIHAYIVRKEKLALSRSESVSMSDIKNSQNIPGVPSRFIDCISHGLLDPPIVTCSLDNHTYTENQLLTSFRYVRRTPKERIPFIDFPFLRRHKTREKEVREFELALQEQGIDWKKFN